MQKPPKQPLIAIVSFPGNNCEVESIRAVKNAGMDALFFKWNDPVSKLENVDGYFLVGGFAYEDRGRAGMVAARDPLFALLHEESAKGKVIIGNCNGAQVLVESGLVPLDHGLKMSLARNALGNESPGFISEWVWITPTCKRDRCATSDWEGTQHLPIAHGEGRFITKDPDVWKTLKANDQLAFSYCDEHGNVSDDPVITPNGSTFAIAGICNPAGNVVALMPHPERTENGVEYFGSMRRWIERPTSLLRELRGAREGKMASNFAPAGASLDKIGQKVSVTARRPRSTEIFIGTIITNNEERTVEQAAHRIVPDLRLTQYKYLSPEKRTPESILSTLSLFNPNKETAVVRKDGKFFRWDSAAKKLELMRKSPLEGSVAFLRRDIPDTGAGAIGEGSPTTLPTGSELRGASQTGVCYVCRGVKEDQLLQSAVLEIFGNPHASVMERLSW
ncbi:MAG: phosphoribosylformylglycinamidine synthase subunit PurQ [Candidatus Peregrinibacteria bacterium]